MAFINYAKREIQFKIVYCGAPSSGKASNLKMFPQFVGQSSLEDLSSINHDGDQILCFNILAAQAEGLKGFATRFFVFTVPGRPLTPETPKAVLTGVDAIVFVVDSDMEQMHENVQAFDVLQEHLIANHLSLAQIPYVLQYNKRDHPNAAPLHYLEYTFNSRVHRMLSFEAVASTGDGVLECLNAAAKLLLAKYVSQQSESAIQSMPEPIVPLDTPQPKNASLEASAEEQMEWNRKYGL